MRCRHKKNKRKNIMLTHNTLESSLHMAHNVPCVFIVTCFESRRVFLLLLLLLLLLSLSSFSPFSFLSHSTVCDTVMYTIFKSRKKNIECRHGKWFSFNLMRNRINDLWNVAPSVEEKKKPTQIKYYWFIELKRSICWRKRCATMTLSTHF